MSDIPAETVVLNGRSVTLIGAYSDRRPACNGTGHLVGCYNPLLDETACVCGKHWWRGDRGSWHARHLHDHSCRGAQILGYDVYLMEAT